MKDVFLIVDDSLTQRMILQKVIKMSGYHDCLIHQAGNGREAVEILESIIPDIIFTDLNMPIMSGEELIEYLNSKEKLKEIPVVVITSKDSDYTRKFLDEEGAAGILIKPFSPEDMMVIIQHVKQMRGLNGKNE
ncbi:MAG: response regulator [Spirochaetales bacterium]|nr:response regulator [Spirochaetales bacterium]